VPSTKDSFDKPKLEHERALSNAILFGAASVIGAALPFLVV